MCTAIERVLAISLFDRPSAARRLAEAGYSVAVVDLPTGSPEAIAVKVFAPGVGGEERRRRVA